MNDKKMFSLLQQFADDSVYSKRIDVSVTSGVISMKPKPGEHAYYDEGNALLGLINGAQSFLWWARRNGYSVTKSSKKMLQKGG